MNSAKKNRAGHQGIVHEKTPEYLSMNHRDKINSLMSAYIAPKTVDTPNQKKAFTKKTGKSRQAAMAGHTAPVAGIYRVPAGANRRIV